MNWIDFVIGGLLANAMPHYILGITNTRFLGPFGYSPKGNIVYALILILLSLGLMIYEYGLEGVYYNGIYVGGLAVLFV